MPNAVRSDPNANAFLSASVIRITLNRPKSPKSLLSAAPPDDPEPTPPDANTFADEGAGADEVLGPDVPGAALMFPMDPPTKPSSCCFCPSMPSTSAPNRPNPPLPLDDARETVGVAPTNGDDDGEDALEDPLWEPPPPPRPPMAPPPPEGADAPGSAGKSSAAMLMDPPAPPAWVASRYFAPLCCCIICCCARICCCCRSAAARPSLDVLEDDGAPPTTAPPPPPPPRLGKSLRSNAEDPPAEPGVGVAAPLPPRE
mmetsp:Transcript_16873/g.34619  ORF Transcript_16873/g.34619 Transcript_16873/m.34619 type:complete len:257 (-) Transcript_16873:104-874(-)